MRGTDALSGLPIARGLALVIFRDRHIADFTSLTTAEVAAYWCDVHTVAQMIEQAFAPRHMNCRLLGNFGAAPARPPCAPVPRRFCSRKISQTDQLIRTGPRGCPSWPEAVAASRRGRLHARGRFFIGNGRLLSEGGPYILQALSVTNGTPVRASDGTKRPPLSLPGRLPVQTGGGPWRLTVTYRFGPLR